MHLENSNFLGSRNSCHKPSPFEVNKNYRSAAFVIQRSQNCHRFTLTSFITSSILNMLYEFTLENGHIQDVERQSFLRKASGTSVPG